MTQDSSLTLSKKFFLSQFGLDHDSGEWPAAIRLGEGRVDTRTSAAETVTSRTDFDEANNTLRMELDYWRMRPNGEQVRHNLFDLEFRLSGDYVIPQGFWVMGRKLYEHATPGEKVVSISSGLVRNANHTRSAVKHIHHALRKGDLPNLMQIFKDTGLHESLGERLSILGQTQDDLFDFPSHMKPPEAKASLVFPKAVAEALLAEDTNSLDAHQRLGASRLVTEVDPLHGTEFASELFVHANEGQERLSTLDIDPISVPEDTEAFAIPKFLTMRTVPGPAVGQTTVGEFKFLGIDLLQADHTTRMKVLGVANRIKHDLRARIYPRTMDHLTEYDLLDWAEGLMTRDHLSPPPPEGRMVVEAKLGHNTGDEIAEGYSHKPDGNCTIIEMQWPDKKGQLKKLGVGHDLGLSLPPDDVANKGAVADVVKNLTYIDYWFLTHDHLDHKSGFIPYIAKGYFRNKIICGTAEQIASLRENLNAYDYPEEYNPVFKELKGRGAIHIKDDEGVTRLSVLYSTEGTPHTARCTPYLYIGRNGSQVIDTYLNPGDMRFGRHNAEGYTGFRPDADYLDTYFFKNWAKILLADDPTIDPDVVNFPIVRCDFDGTSIRKAGYAPTDWECEANRNLLFDKLKDLLPEKHIGAAQISSNEMGFESWLRVATRQGRDITTAGANIEKKARVLNVHGVNKLRLEAEKKRNIQLYLDNYFWQLSDERLAVLRGTELEIEHFVRQSFAKLRSIKQANHRIAKRDLFEKEMMERFGETRHLGSIYTSITSNVSRRLTRQPERWLTLETGTQGSFVEIDSTVYKRSEGRSRFDMRASKKHTARPLPPQKTILCIAQTAIPGNEKKQKIMVDRLVERGYAVIVSAHDSVEIYGMPEKVQQVLETFFAGKNHPTNRYEDGGLFIGNLPIHAPGHGYEKDIEGWLKLVNPIFAMLQHTGDPQGVQKFLEVVPATLNRRGHYFGNFERVATERIPAEPTADAKGWKIFTLGSSIPSIILIEMIRKVRQYYGGHIEATRVVRFDGQGKMSQDGLMASVKPEGAYRQHFASVNTETVRRKSAADTARRPEPVPYNRTLPVSERIYRGPRRPDDDLYDGPAGARQCAA